MKFLITTLLLLAATSAFAHIDIGTYKGKSADGSECKFKVEAVDFQFEIHHPLNERVTITIDDAKFVFQHLPLIDAATKTVKPEGGKLTSAAGTNDGSFAFVLEMEHTPTHEGPVSMTAIFNDKDPAKSLSDTCTSLVFEGK